MRVALCTLCINELEWLPKLYEQHKDWPGLVSWVFVEGSDAIYAQSNPTLVKFPHGLSVDGTTEFLQELSQQDRRISHITLPSPIAYGDKPDQSKCLMRQYYLNALKHQSPDYIVILDADEFYVYADQLRISSLVEEHIVRNLRYDGIVLRQRHLWRPIDTIDLFQQEVIGAYWSVPHCRVWKWSPYMQYVTNHNRPEGFNRLNRQDKIHGTPNCIHMGFSSSQKLRAAKHAYYVARGEGPRDGRQMYVDCRTAFEKWRPGISLPHGARVIPYNGEIPEAFKLAGYTRRGVDSQ